MADPNLKKTMTLHGFRLADFGPSCTGYAKEEQDCVWVVTSQEEPYNTPKSIDEPVLVCKYTKDWDYIEGSDMVYDSLKGYLEGKEGQIPSWIRRGPLRPNL